MGRTRLVDRFKARSERGDYETRVYVYQEMLDASSHDCADAEIPGLRFAKSSDGFSCTYVDEGCFRVDHPRFPEGVVVRRVE